MRSGWQAIGSGPLRSVTKASRDAGFLDILHSARLEPRLTAFMPRSIKRTLHPLLLERSYWRNRLQELNLARQSVLLIPRPELSSAAIVVDEFRIRAYDGLRLFGLKAQSRFGGARAARVRVVGPSELPRIDRATIESGWTEYVLQEPAGRKLEDRVLDVLRVCQLAMSGENVDPKRITLAADVGREPDEFLIASQLLADDGTPTRPSSPLDDGAGWSSQ